MAMSRETLAQEDPNPWSRNGVQAGIRPREVLWALAASLGFVVLTRVPVMRTVPMDSDEFGFLEMIQVSWFPMFHTLFLASARLLGLVAGDAYRGFVALDVVISALALVSTWWWLRAVVRPQVALAATLVMACSPVFWAYGAMAANYTAIVLVGSFLLGVAVRTATEPRSWHPYAVAVVLALGTGYRQDLGTFWLPVFVWILWRHRWAPALRAGLLFTVLNLAWLGLMLQNAGGWHRYRAASAEFGYHAGYLNSVWNLGLVDGTLRHSLKAAMALCWTLGPGLALVPRGLVRLWREPKGPGLASLLVVSMVPALCGHLIMHFGSPGYAFHYVPALIALVALGIGRSLRSEDRAASPVRDHAPARLVALAAVLALVFLFYPTSYDSPGFRGSFDLAFGRQTRVGLRTPVLQRAPSYWRTANSVNLPGSPPIAGGGIRGN